MHNSSPIVTIALLLLATPAMGASGKPAEMPDEIEQRDAKGWEACKELSGYSQLRERFDVEEATWGVVNLPVVSLFVQLRSTNAIGLNAAWWWNPIVDGAPRYSWSDFLTCFGEAQQLVSKHVWLSDWLQTTPGRTLELHSFGCAPESLQFEMDYRVLPLWSDARLMGQPKYEILARRKDSGWARIFLSSDEPQALIAYTLNSDNESKHWLDRLEISFHPRCQGIPKNSRYVTVRPNGEQELHVFSHCEP